MRIISLNVNNFGGKCPKPLLKDYKIDDVINWDEWDNDIDDWRDKNKDNIFNNVNSIVDIICDYEVVFLHEVDTNCDSWDYLRKKMTEYEYEFEMPNGIKEYKKGKKSTSCAFVKKGINYTCSSRNSFDGYNRNVEIQIEDIYLVGVHMNYKYDMWKSFYKLAKDISGKKALIIGDLNVFDDGTERKEVLKSLMDSYGWEDVWIYQGEASDTPTCDTEKRIDYVLATKSFVVGGVREIIINDIRRQGISDHAAVVALL